MLGFWGFADAPGAEGAGADFGVFQMLLGHPWQREQVLMLGFGGFADALEQPWQREQVLILGFGVFQMLLGQP